MQIMEEDRTSGRVATSQLFAGGSSSEGVGSHSKLNMELSADHSTAQAASVYELDESEPLLSVTQRIQEKREGR